MFVRPGSQVFMLNPTFLGCLVLLKMKFDFWPSKNHQNVRFSFFEVSFFVEYFSFLVWYVFIPYFFLKVICEEFMRFLTHFGSPGLPTPSCWKHF